MAPERRREIAAAAALSHERRNIYKNEIYGKIWTGGKSGSDTPEGWTAMEPYVCAREDSGNTGGARMGGASRGGRTRNSDAIHKWLSAHQHHDHNSTDIYDVLGGEMRVREPDHLVQVIWIDFAQHRVDGKIRRRVPDVVDVPLVAGREVRPG